MFPKWIQYLDPPEHTRLREIIGEAFNPEMIRNQRADVQTVTEELIAGIKAEDPEEIEIIDDFAFPLPVRIISKIMGLPAEDTEKIGEWSADTVLTLFHYYGVEDRHERTERGVREFYHYLRDVVEGRKANPGDDLVSYLLEAESGGEQLTDEEVIATAMLLLLAGHETTTKQLANGFLELLLHPDQMEMLREDPSLAPKAVEEIIRYQGVSLAATRAVVEDFELRGNHIKAGERVYLSNLAANRDPRKFDNPNEFDITRGSTDHLGFGHGTHYCIGAPLARLEMRVAFPTFVRAFPEMELATEEVEWIRSMIARGPEELRLTV
jgi:cytochrome P450